ncbi:hypothetical protein ACFOGJ_17425 [Marinibaculum pumilum]|uniref:Uncharacterized protein n=1 Tax=Marinibaculum pumilum TaxID=1766165 RepID=A0ABV7L2Y6_9PROT
MLQAERRCASCGDASLVRIAGQDGWSLFRMGGSLHYWCPRCQAAARDVGSRGATLGSLLVGSALLALAASPGGPAAFMSDLLLHPGTLFAGAGWTDAPDILMLYLLGFGFAIVFLALPILVLAFAGRTLLFRLRNPRLAQVIGMPHAEGTTRSPTRAGVGQVLVRSAIVGLPASLVFLAVARWTESEGALVLLTGLLVPMVWWLLIGGLGQRAVAWVTLVLFFLFLTLSAFLVDTLNAGVALGD